MSDFRVIEIIDGNTIKVSPFWQMGLRNNDVIKGDKIYIRGLEGLENNQIVKKRLEKILINTNEAITFDAPELIDSDNYENALVSCSVYVGRTNIAYYFPEFVSK